MFECSRLRQIAEALRMQVVAHLLEHLEVTLRPHLVEDDAHDVEILSEIEESIDLGSQRIGSRLGIDYEHHRES